MGRKHVVKTFKMAEAADISANFTTPSTNVLNLDQASIHVRWQNSAAIMGEIQIEARNGADEPWYVLDFNTTMAVDTDDSFLQIVFREMPFTDIRLQYVSTSGTADMDATLTMKTVGA